MLRGASCGLLLLCAAGCRREAPLLEVQVLGASAVQGVDGGERYWFDAPDAPRLITDATTFSWSPAAEVTSVVDGGVVFSRPADGLYALTLRRDGATRIVQLGFRTSVSKLADSFAARARVNLESTRAALEGVAPEDWPWACLGVARAVPVGERSEAHARCAEGAEARGFFTEAVNRRLAAIYWARRARQYGQVPALISRVQRALEQRPDPLTAARLHYQQGLFFAGSGQLREATAVLQQSALEAETAGVPGEATAARAYLAVVSSEAGRHAEALKLAAEAEKGSTAGLADARGVRSNVTWVRLRAHTRGLAGVDVPSLREELTRQVTEAETAGARLDASNYASNLAWLELFEGRLAASQAALQKARALADGAQTVEAVFLDWLDGRLALASSDGAAAVRAFQRMTGDPLDAERVPESSWRAQLGLAEAWLLQGNAVEATRALAEARRSLSSQARGFGDPRERVSFLQDRRTAIADAVRAFVKAGKCDLAWRLADDAQASLARSFEADRRVRLAQLPPKAREAFEAAEERWSNEREALLADVAPSLASVKELEAWKERRAARYAALSDEATRLAASLDAQAPLPTRPAFEPSSLARDEALLEFFDDLAFFVRGGGPVTCGRDAGQLTKSPLRSLVVVDPAGRLSASSLRALLEHASVTFVPSAAWLTQPWAPVQGAPLVIGDPRRDLPAARDEARALSKQLNGELLEGDAATLDAITARWSSRPLLHFAGHGRVSAGAPWEARLDLAKGQSLDFELLLARRPSPGLVVLSGCETGRPLDGIGLAEGFLAAGARHVLATTVEVKDEDARRFVERFYRLGGLEAPTEAFRLAVKEADAAHDESWSQWRLFGAPAR
ncbi:MAG: hypothetical protein DI536_08180 [Archangium gephyra]|uniref:CHAT domain-containing protein n=1 Tax=Archangium gephyra TaxID=48 RepID=A0A2W5TIJ8_9BACT|nr:MAG: hypothetical protein DI536_08180 [Archangium gephyra]